MEIAPGSAVGSFIGQLPLLVAYGMGLVIALRRRAQDRRAARLAIIAFSLLLVDLILLDRFTFWLLGYLIQQGFTESSIMETLTVTNLARALVQALAVWLLVRAIFPVLPGTVRPPWLVRVVGGLIGLVVGFTLAFLLGDAIGELMGVTTFEGARGYFVVMCLMPVFMIAGAVGGVLAAPWVRKRPAAQPEPGVGTDPATDEGGVQPHD
jgi:hypothetical protein